MRTWDTFYPLVLPQVPGCPDPTLDDHLLGAAREFCALSRAWRSDLAPIALQAGIADYPLVFDAGTQGHILVGASLNGQDIDLDVPDATSTSERRRGSGGARRVLAMDMTTITVMPTPAGAQSLVLTAILQPSETAEGLPDPIADRYRRIIASGALATLLTMNAAPWINVRLAGIKREEFERETARVKSRVWRGNSNARPRNSAQFF